VSDGVLTRTVADTAEVLDIMAGYELGDANWAPLPAVTFAELARREPGRLRIGLALNPPLEGAALDPVCEAAARDAATLLEALGHHVEETEPPWSNLDLLSDFTRAFGPLVSLTTMLGGRIAGREPTEADVEPLTWALWKNARSHDTLSVLSAQGRLEAVARSIVRFLDAYDAVLTPALALRPVPIGEIHGLGPNPWAHYRRSGHFTPYTAIINVTGLPAISLPLYHGDDGLPTGVQLIGPPVREDIVLQLATQLEQALPWSGRRPEIVRSSTGGRLSTSVESAASPRRSRVGRHQRSMAYVIAEPCIGTKDNSCVEVCPVDCIHPTPDEPDYDASEMLYIDPEECIDCDACVEACPVDACFAEDQLPEEWQKYVQINATYYAGKR
jgi:amidase